VGTFRDVLALLETEREAPAFAQIPDLGQGNALLRELGCNALELLPPADSDDDLGWGYGTANFLSADFQLGGGSPATAPAALSELRALVACCHRHGMRFFDDMVMAFARSCPYRRIAFADFFVTWKAWGDPTRDPEQGARDGFGGDLFRYQHWVEGYHPIHGRLDRFVPAREYMKVHLAHWLDYYRVDGLRLDSVNNTGSDDFLGEFRALARELWRTADRGQGTPAADLEPRFLVIGEELSVPVGLVSEGRLDGLWNERFKQILRQLLLGRGAEGLSLEESVRRLVDCRELGFSDGAQAVNYVTSHDVGGAGNERLYDYLARAGVVETEARIKLAFACLLTAVGIPMILAGEEFADQHDLDVQVDWGGKQVDPVNYARRSDAWRRRIFDHVARLVRLRTESLALGQNDTALLHVDLEDGKRVFVWQRGTGDDRVVVVANFSDWGTADPLVAGAEYVVPGFPVTPEGRHWREIAQDRDVPPQWIGREPIFPWEAKVYSLEPFPASH
jgi:1,4-alpha-glucan branching enzyme